MSEAETETPPDAPTTRVQRRWIVMPFAIFVLLIVAYLAVWFKARDEALQKFAGWVRAECRAARHQLGLARNDDQRLEGRVTPGACGDGAVGGALGNACSREFG